MNAKRLWPWLVAIVWLVGYELVAVFTHHTTLSEMVWRASAAWPLLPVVAIPLVVLLVAHFWFGVFAPDRTNVFHKGESDGSDQ